MPRSAAWPWSLAIAAAVLVVLATLLNVLAGSHGEDIVGAVEVATYSRW